MDSETAALNTARQNLSAQLSSLTEHELRVIEHLINRRHVSRDPKAFRDHLTMGQRIADTVASFGGSWRFILIFIALMIVWITFNKEIARPFDPYPFILLNLVLSCLAALQAPIIMMSQNRQADKDRFHAQQDYEVNLKAELEILSLHVKLDELRKAKWTELVAEQDRQIAILERIEASLSNHKK
jgi:uncharacterized membrane protein